MRLVAAAALAFLLYYPIRTEALVGEPVMVNRVGKVWLYVPEGSAQPAHVALFVSGDGGWNEGVDLMARELTTMNTLVVGIDIVHYRFRMNRRGQPCTYTSADFEGLSQFIQRRQHFSKYQLPVLIGYSSGATLVYATLVQAPPNTFAGAISLGFCPDLHIDKPLCRAEALTWQQPTKRGVYTLLPATDLQSQWIVIQGIDDKVCNDSATEAYAKQIPHGRVISLPRVGHGFHVTRRWLPEFQAAFSSLFPAPPQNTANPSVVQVTADVKNLPLVELPVRNSSGDKLVLVISGDGGWASIDRQIANYLVEHGIPVVGLNSLQYFWTRRTPDGAAKDLARVIRHYLLAWKKNEVILVGYSLGADVLPFMAARLPPDLLGKVQLIALLGPGDTADFEFHLADWFSRSSHSGDRPTLPEVQKLKGNKILCFYGTKERVSLCKDVHQDLMQSIPLQGGHHFGDDYKTIAERIYKAAAS
jgi:type IV secretory pathway VirJ component